MTLSTQTADGGRVDSFVDASSGLNVLHAQKYDASGQKVGAELTFSARVAGPYDVAALAGGGYAVVYQSASPGGSWGQISVQDAAGAVIGQGSTAAGYNFHITAAQDGGFLVSSQGIPADHGLSASQPLVQLYDPTGQSLTHGHIELAGQITAINAAAGGAMAVSWDDGGVVRTLSLDPHAAALTTPATPAVTVLDDVGAATGPVAAGAVTDDATPTFRIAVSQTGEAFVELDKDSGAGATYQNHGGGIAITAADVARGYIDVTLPTSGDGHYLAWARVTDDAGSASYPVALDFTVQAPAAPAAGVSDSAPTGQTFTAAKAGDAVTGTAGADTITAGDGGHTLFGGDGDDMISGGTGFNVVNGNKGDDTIAGNSSVGDWLSGGQGDDRITAVGGANVVNGNLGNDTLVGGAGHDVIRGGQGADSIVAGAGDSWISGDRGDDTIQAGAGSDVIVSFAGSGADRVLGFDPLHDRVQVDAGAHVSVSQLGSDTLVDLGGGDQLVLVGVQTSSLAGGWLIH